MSYITIIKGTNGQLDCQYGITTPASKGVEYYTHQFITQNQLQEIRECKANEVQNILSRYLK